MEAALQESEERNKRLKAQMQSYKQRYEDLKARSDEADSHSRKQVRRSDGYVRTHCFLTLSRPVLSDKVSIQAS